MAAIITNGGLPRTLQGGAARVITETRSNATMLLSGIFGDQIGDLLSGLGRGNPSVRHGLSDVVGSSVPCKTPTCKPSVFTREGFSYCITWAQVCRRRFV
ncbi:MAG: hypothetical protein LBB61_00500 [Treponema sp.]|nr:hypothetical protein [Treponema sp.]